MASPDAIRKILRDMRAAIDSGKFHPISRDKNRRTLALLGITWADAKDEIYSLTEHDYYSGPMLDHADFSSDHFWEFKKSVDGHLIYIKFKVMYQEDGRVKVVGFHIDGMR